jgi:molybdopterin synthase catalytic subunit
MIGLTDTTIEVAALREAVSHDGHGAILVFEGVARDNLDGPRVQLLAYEAYAELAEPVMQAIADEARERFGARVALVHRTGRVGIGEASLVIAVGTPHRPECYEASRYVLEQVKQRLPVWKKEITDDGSEWKANAPG